MRVAVFSAGLFVATFALHWLLWRVWLPRRQTQALLRIFLAALPIAFILAPFLPFLEPWRPQGVWEHLHVAIFHVALSLAYVVVNSTLQDDSPSCILVTFLAESATQGRSRDEIIAIFDDRFLILPRLAAMVAGGLVAETTGVYRLTDKGVRWIAFFVQCRQLFRVSKGG